VSADVVVGVVIATVLVGFGIQKTG
jgi:hypothetical protein